MAIKNNFYDVIVVGAGHAGIEASCAAARMGCLVAIFTINKKKIGHMPCNPAVGGIGKGHIVFEIAALGGVMPKACSGSYLQSNMLNKSRGPAVQGLRLQIDKVKYSEEILKIIEDYKNIEIVEDVVENILVNENSEISAIESSGGKKYFCKSLIITAGTFLNGLVHFGLKNFSSGRLNEPAVYGLSNSIRKLGFDMGRLKTGTPARILKESVDFSKMEEQQSHNLNFLFEFEEKKIEHKMSCFITRTNKKTHEIIISNAHLSPIYRGDIKGVAPRYCPSIEDKIKRFADKDSHQIFIEPESIYSNELYPNGISTSLPIEVQEKFIRTINGLENAVISQAGYAIEYDFIFPNKLKHTLESKKISGLFFAGQINGTTGYEEAAGQGLIAGINSACLIKNIEPFVIDREDAYIGVMIDDLVTLGVDEPYRMFTSRAERRLLLRQDNSFYRLYEKSFQYGLIKNELYEKIDFEYKQCFEILNKVSENKNMIDNFAKKISDRNPDEVREEIRVIGNNLLNDRQIEYIFAEILYKPYYDREIEEIEKMKYFRELQIPEILLKESNIPGISKELQQKLLKYKPQNIAQANLIQGMTPAAISILIFKSREFQKKA
jgi:tRNA uridine 5-carboxymethylaminomethyl modification enzyme